MRSKYQGFTLTELLIVIAIVAIMAAIAFPNMSQWIASRRAASQAEQVANLLRFARSEAVRLNLPVYVCPVPIRDDGTPSRTYCSVPADSKLGYGLAAYANKDDQKTYNRDEDIDLRTVILNAKGENKISFRTSTYDFKAESEEDGRDVWIFYPNGTFGHAVNVKDTPRIGSGFIKITVTNAESNKTDKASQATILLIDSSGRVQKCESGATETIAKLCKYKDEQPSP